MQIAESNIILYSKKGGTLIMVEKMAIKLVQQLERERLISREAREHYEYALITLVERFITIGTIFFIAVIYKQIIPTICFLFFFLSLRKRTGGYHADKFWKCYVGTVLTYVVLIKIAAVFSKNLTFLYGLLFFSIILIEIIGTVNHPNMDMEKDELRESKNAARLLVILDSIIILLSIALGIDKLYVIFMSIAIILCATLLCLAKIIKQEVKSE